MVAIRGSRPDAELFVASAGCADSEAVPGAGPEGVGDLRQRVDDLAVRLGGLAGHEGAVQVVQADLRQAAARLDGLDALAAGLGRALSQGLGAVDGRLLGVQADLDSVATHLGTLFREREQRATALKVSAQPLNAIKGMPVVK